MPYNLDELSNRIIWVFTQPRSGTAWFLLSLYKQLGRKRRTITVNKENQLKNNPQPTMSPRINTEFDSIKQEYDDTDYILDTHNFFALRSIMNNYHNPIVIQTARKNKTEQFLSAYIARLVNQYHAYSQEEYMNYPHLENIIVDKADIDLWIEVAKRRDFFWDKFASNYESEIVYYEDLLQGWQSKILPVTLSMNDTDPEIRVLKSPYNKKEVILNYDEVDSIIKQAF